MGDRNYSVLNDLFEQICFFLLELKSAVLDYVAGRE